MSHLTNDIRANIKKLSADIERLRRAAKNSADDTDRAKELSLQIMQLTERRTLLEKNLASA
jgi:outer membrane murein-binding lipoprotein Lpp